MTMVIATHEMGFARDIADRVCFLDAGQILEEGPPAEIFGNPQRAANTPVPRSRHRGWPHGWWLEWRKRGQRKLADYCAGNGYSSCS